MPRTTPNPNRRTAPTSPKSPSKSAPEVVDPRWLLKALGLVLVVAVVCGYLTYCLIFYIGQWQIVLHPTRTTSSQPPVVNASAEFLRFAPDDSAAPQLTGWWIPATSGGKYAQTTLLYLPSGDGSLTSASATLTALHSLGINLFAIDYRGYGQSAPIHPSQKNLTEDAESAWHYLRTTRNLPEQQIVPYGVGVGTSLAAHLAAAHPLMPAIILESPQSDFIATLGHDARSSLLPTSLLFHENFPLAGPLTSLRTPKLLLSGSQPAAPFKTAADPKMSVELNALAGAGLPPEDVLPSITRFLDQYLLPSSAPQAIPTPVTK